MPSGSGTPRAGEDLPEIIERTYPGCAWSADSRQLFYLVPDELNRPWQVWRHRIGTDASADVLVLAEPDARFELTLHASRSGRIVVITAASRDTTEVHVIPAADPEAGPACVAARRPGIEYAVDHAADPAGGPGELYIVTNDGAREYRLMRAPLSAPGRQNWTEVPCGAVSPARGDTRLVCCDVFTGHLLLTLRRGGAPLLVITDLAGGGIREVPAAMPVGSIRVEHAEAYDAGTRDHRGGVADRAAGLVRARPGHRPPPGAQAQRRARLPAVALPDLAAARDRRRRHRGPGHPRLPGRHAAGRQRPVPALRLRRLRVLRVPGL